jgi:hypothetical protein
MARKAGQLVSRGSRTWLVRVSLGRDPETGARKYHNKTIRGSIPRSANLPERKTARTLDWASSPRGSDKS